MPNKSSFVAVALGASLLAGCGQAKLQYDLINYQQTCFGSQTVECVASRVDLNERLIATAIASLENREVALSADLPPEELEAGLRILRHLEEINEQDRPGFFFRWFMAYREYPGGNGPLNYVVTLDELGAHFATGVDAYRSKTRPSAAPPPSAATPADVSSAASCTDAWIAAHRREAGEDAAIRADMLEEWDAWCAEGTWPPNS